MPNVLPGFQRLDSKLKKVLELSAFTPARRHIITIDDPIEITKTLKAHLVPIPMLRDRAENASLQKVVG
jgi:hypothetical protein